MSRITSRGGATFEPSPGFPETRWSVICRAGDHQTRVSTNALDILYRGYSYPLYAFLRRSGHSPQDAQDWVQSFFVYIVEHRVVTKATESKGRFRSFLLGTLKNFVSSEQRKMAAQKRGGGERPISLDDEDVEQRYAREPAAAHTPETLFELSWARTLLARAAASLEAEYLDTGRHAIFIHLQPYLESGRAGLSYRETAAALGKSEDAIKSGVQRLRQQFQHWLRSHIAETVITSAEVDDELVHLRQVLMN
ncbi:MAG: sigma-70 family RNA polymerase sigma factor [Verrucomicrobia bacterium]|nr:sigma-70 family RNA polymerase sigma factor [Verrucomicrobiota bacterium]